ncbi:MAG TPA: transposase [Balneolales bacterium]|nr:transposase [Balneolales bacterium]
MEQQIGQLGPQAWTPIRLGWQKMEVAELPWNPFGGTKTYRLIITRMKRKDRQADLFSGKAYTWRAILSNDSEATPKQIVAFYNKRGTAERLFDEMGNDFGWKKLPCSFLSENTAFMILTGIIANFYHYLIELYSEHLGWIKPTYRIKKFIFRFITVPAKWIRSGRRDILKLYTEKDYACLLE